MIRSLQHVAITLPDPRPTAAFYTAFGLDVSEAGGSLVARCRGRDQDQIVITEGARRGLAYVSFATRPAELAQTKRSLEARGVALLDPPHQLRRELPDGLWFRDPDGNLVHVGSQPDLPPRSARTVTLNSSAAYPRRGQRGCPPFGSDARPLRLGHVLLFSPDPGRQAAFYCDVLGMKLSDKVIDDLAIFLRGAADGDHHMLGFIREAVPGVHHMSFEIDSLDHMALGAMRIRESGFASTHLWGPGRHSIGSNFFHYFRAPWGSLIEYFHDVDYIDEGAPWDARTWTMETGLFLWSSDGPPPPDFPRNLVGAG